MNSRERTLMALAHEQPDRPPVSASYTPEIAALLRLVYGRPEEDLGYVMGNDLVKTTVGIELSYHRSDDPVYTCPFGVTFRNVKNFAGAYTEIIGGALRDDPDGEKLKAYTIPDPDDTVWYAPVKAAVSKYGREKFIIGSCQCSIFETSWYLHGLEDTLCDMLADEDYVAALFDKVMYFPLRAGLNLIDCGVDMVWLGDDVATQRDMMFSVELWRKLLKPRYAEIFAALKAKRPDILIAYHSCGNCEQILDDMTEIGLDVLNPIQPLSMDPVYIKRRYGKRLTLFGAIDVQQLLPFGSPGEIKKAVRDAKAVLGEGGGYILSPAHHIQSDTSLENIQAYYEEAFR
jgi:uroporphyrinogen decarboxylase